LRDEFSVCGSGGIEVLVVLFELEAKVDGVLFERDDLLFELIDAIGRAEARLVPGLFAECFGEALFELVDAAARRTARCCALSRSVWRDARRTAGPTPGAFGGWVSAAWICSRMS